MSAELAITLILMSVYCLVVIGPLVPAVVTYKLFPSTNVGLSGPLQGLTVRATGAFAAYIIVFVLMLPLTNRILDVVGGFSRPAWTIHVDIEARDRNNRDVTSTRLLESATLLLRPEIHTLSTRSLRLSIPGASPDGWPLATVHIPGWGAGEIDLGRSANDATWNSFRKTVTIKQPIVIREYEGSTTPYAGNQPYLTSQESPR